MVEMLNLIKRQLGDLNQHPGYPTRERNVAGVGDQIFLPRAQTPCAYSSLRLVDGDISFRKQTILAAEVASSRASASSAAHNVSTTLDCLQSVVQSQITPEPLVSRTLTTETRRALLPVEVASMLCNHANSMLAYNYADGSSTNEYSSSSKGIPQLRDPKQFGTHALLR